MGFLCTWAGLMAMFIFAVATFAFNSWSRAARTKAVREGCGLDVIQLGTSMAGAGLLMGASGPFFGGIPPALLCRDLAGEVLLGTAAELLVMKRATAEWDANLRQSQALQPHVVKWWESRWVILAAMIALLLFSLFNPAAVDSIADTLGNFGSASGYLLSGLFLASGLHITLWARKRARQYGRPITLPMIRK